MFLSIFEIVDAIIISLALGYIFMDSFKKYAPKKEEDSFFSFRAQKFDWDDFKFAALVTAPAIILHEFGHKFVAIAFGLSATFQAAYVFLALGVVLKLINFPFLIFVPAFVSFAGAPPLQSAAIAFAGPAVNGFLWLISHIVIKRKMYTKKSMHFFFVFRYINGFLFIFNLIPIPPFDGGHLITGLYDAFF